MQLPLRTLRYLLIVCFIAMIVLGLAWELWLAPLRPGGSMLALKVLPLALALPGLWRGRVRVYQWWSMATLLYVCEGVVRATSDTGLSAALATGELVLSGLAYVVILLYVRGVKKANS